MGARLSVANVAHLIWGVTGRVERSGHEQGGDHHEPKRKRVHDDHARPTHRPATIPPADEEDGDTCEAERAHRQERHAKRQQRHVLVGRHFEEVVRTKPAERHARQLQDHGRDICARDEGSLQRSMEASRRKGEKHVHEQDRRHEVERLAEGERQVIRRPRQRRNEIGEPRGDHQGAEAALRPPPPRIQAAQHVGERQPVAEQRDHERLAQLGANQRVPQHRYKRDRRRSATRQGDRPEHKLARRRACVAQIRFERCCCGDSRAASVLLPFRPTILLNLAGR